MCCAFYSILVGGFRRGELILGSLFILRFNLEEADILEFNTRSGIVDLQPDPSLLEVTRSHLVTKGGGEFSVDKKFELIASGKDPYAVPMVAVNG